jgi:hypothetical protein
MMIVITAIHQQEWQRQNMKEYHHRLTRRLASAPQHQSYQLTGIHSSLACTACHQSGYPGQYAGATEDDCYTCHANDYQSAANHVSSGYPLDCTGCHSSSNTWQQVTNYSHTTFGFRGAHQGIRNDCALCHASGTLPAGTTDDDCYNCHMNTYQSVSSPSHTQNNFSTDCAECHSENSWQNASYTHQNFLLEGKHRAMNCDKCHQSGYPGQYAGITDDNCIACHMNDYNKKHETCSYDCTLCHNLNNWGNPEKREGCK